MVSETNVQTEEFIRNIARAHHLGPSPQNLGRFPTDVSVVNTTTETDLAAYTVAGGQLVGDWGVRLAADGRNTNDLAVGGLPPTPTATFRLYFGATKLWQDVVFVADDAAISDPWSFDVTIHAKNSAALQEMYGKAFFSNATMPNTGEGRGASPGSGGPIYGESAEDATVDQVLRLTVQLSDADPSFECLLRRYIVELI